MFTKIMKWVSVPVLILALLWPWSAGYQTLKVFFTFCTGAMLAAQANRAGKYFWQAGYTMVSREVKYEN